MNLDEGQGMQEPESGAALPAVRIGDSDRQASVERLRDACRDGMLTLDEFADRVTVALAATTRGELDAVVADVQPSATGGPPRAQRGLRWNFAVFGSNRKRVRWRLVGRARAVAIGGACGLDLRRATIDGDEVLVTAIALFGTVKILVPEGIGVELTGLPVFGAKVDETHDGDLLPDGPVVRVRGIPIFGSVRVRTEIVRQRTPEQRQLADDIVRKQLGLPLRQLSTTPVASDPESND